MMRPTKTKEKLINSNYFVLHTRNKHKYNTVKNDFRSVINSVFIKKEILKLICMENFQ